MWAIFWYCTGVGSTLVLLFFMAMLREQSDLTKQIQEKAELDQNENSKLNKVKRGL